MGSLKPPNVPFFILAKTLLSAPTSTTYYSTDATEEHLGHGTHVAITAYTVRSTGNSLFPFHLGFSFCPCPTATQLLSFTWLWRTPSFRRRAIFNHRTVLRHSFKQRIIYWKMERMDKLGWKERHRILFLDLFLFSLEAGRGRRRETRPRRS